MAPLGAGKCRRASSERRSSAPSIRFRPLPSAPIRSHPLPSTPAPALPPQRWLSIPSSDGEWSRKRRLWTAATPPMASLVFATGLLFDGEAPSYSPFVATMLGSVGGGEGGFPNMVLVMLLSTSLCPLLYLLSVDNKPPRFQAGLVVCGFAMTIVWLKIIASEMIALIETFGHLFGVSTVTAVGCHARCHSLPASACLCHPLPLAWRGASPSPPSLPPSLPSSLPSSSPSLPPSPPSLVPALRASISALSFTVDSRPDRHRHRQLDWGLRRR